MLALITGIILTFWGLWAIIAFFLGKKSQFFMFIDETYLFRKVLGKHFDSTSNILWGILWFIIGLTLIIDNI